jgi:hypothetical protein
VDDVFYDAARKRIYVIGGEGKVDVIKQVNEDIYEPLAIVATGPGARTGLFVPELSRLFVAVPANNGQPAEIRIFETVN